MEKDFKYCPEETGCDMRKKLLETYSDSAFCEKYGNSRCPFLELTEGMEGARTMLLTANLAGEEPGRASKFFENKRILLAGMNRKYVSKKKV